MRIQCGIALLVVTTLATGCGGGSSGSGAGDHASVTAPAGDTAPVDVADVNADTGDCAELASHEGFGLASCSPSPDATYRALVTDVELEFSAALLASTVTSDTLFLARGEAVIPADVVHESGSQRVKILPLEPLQPGTRFDVHVTEKVMSAGGISFPGTSWSFTTADDVGATPQTVIDGCMSDWDVEMLAQINRARSAARQCGENEASAVAPLSWSCDIEDVAHRHSKDMAELNFFSHTGSDGTSAGDRLTEAGYRWQTWAENIAAGQTSIAQVMGELLDSPGHCDNIMNPRFAEVGAAMVENPDSDYGRYWTQNFARPY